LFWYYVDYQAVTNFYKNCFIKSLTYKILLVYLCITDILKEFFYGKM
jgi:hypothetical protein